MHKLKERFSSNSNKASIFLKDADSVIAMKRSKSGAITLKFSSGREIVVNELYSDSSKLLGDKNRRVGLNLNAKKMSEDELNILVSKHSDTTAIKKPNGEFKTLKGLGVKTMKKLSNNLFHLILHDNSQFSAKELYNITFMDKFLSRFANNFLKDNDEFLSTNSKNSSNATKIFFQKVNARV